MPTPCACGVLHRLAGLPSFPHIKALHLWGTVLGKGVHWLGSIWLSVLRLPAHPLATPKCHTPSPCEPPVLRRSAHLSWCSTNSSTLGKLARITNGRLAPCQGHVFIHKFGQAQVPPPASTAFTSLTGGSTRTPTAGMPSAFLRPLSVPCGPSGLRRRLTCKS